MVRTRLSNCLVNLALGHFSLPMEEDLTALKTKLPLSTAPQSPMKLLFCIFARDFYK